MKRAGVRVERGRVEDADATLPRGQSGNLGKAQVVADCQSEAAVRRVKHSKRLAGREGVALLVRHLGEAQVEQVRLAVLLHQGTWDQREIVEWTGVPSGDQTVAQLYRRPSSSTSGMLPE